jgi:hypothetical protein
MTQQIEIKIELPQHDSYGEIMKAYFSLMRGFGIELGMRCDTVLGELEGPQWWTALKEQRRAEGRWKGAINLHDPSITLPEYVYADGTPLAKALSGKLESKVFAKKLHLARNSWVHFSEAPGPAQLEEVAGLLKQFASLNGLKIEAAAARMIRRLQRIRSGQYQPYGEVIAKWRIDNEPIVAPADGPATVEVGPPVAEKQTLVEHPVIVPTVERLEPVEPTDEVIEIETPAIERRPAIGARWSGEILTARYIPSAIGDLVDPSTGEGLRAQVGPDLWPRKRRLWLAARPLGGVWVDDRDGAVGGFVDNVARLLGYLGDEPDDGLARGFLTPRYYEVDGDRIVDLDSGIALLDAVPAEARDQAAQLQAEVFAATMPHAGLRLSTYGDLVAVTDEGAVRVAVVEPEYWFAGHLA